MPNLSEYQHPGNDALVLILESQAEKISSNSKISYRKAIKSLKAFLDAGKPPFPLFSGRFLESWLIDMFFAGLSVKTAVHYFSIISALYSAAQSEANLPSAEDFPAVKARFLSLAPFLWKAKINSLLFYDFVDKVRNAFFSEQNEDAAARIIIFALLNPSLSVGEIVALRKEDIPALSPESRKIAEDSLESRHKFVFPLSQSRLTPNQMAKLGESIISSFFEERCIPLFGSVDETLKTYWAYSAYLEDVSPQYITSIAGPLPSGLAIFSLCSGVQPSGQLKSEILHKAGERFLENPKKWFALRLRKGIRYKYFQKEFNACSPSLPGVDIFYPISRIAKNKGGKIKFRNVPVMGAFVFVNARLPQFEDLLRECQVSVYPCRPASPDQGRYLEIPDSAMHIFQTAIGQFSASTEMGPFGSIPLRKGDRIVVLGGIFSGLQGEFLEGKFNSSGVIYRLRLFGDNNDIEWRINDPRLIQKLNP